MPAHVVVGHVAVIVAPLAALLALVYALAAGSRRGTRAGLVAAATIAFGLCAWAGEAGGDLLDELSAATPADLPEEVATHAHGSDALTVAAFVLLAVVLAVVWRWLRPGRTAGTAPRVAQVALVLASLGVLLTTATVLTAAMRAVWATQPGWVA